MMMKKTAGATRLKGTDMEINQSLLKSGERAMLALRGLYSQYGYSLFKMSKFEEYDFYAQSKSFLRNGSMITFTGAGGRLMALRPDVTMSIVKNVKGNPPQPVKVYYNENVYRAGSEGQEPSEILQTGLECIGDIDLYQTGEVLMLAARSLAMIGEDYILDISHIGLLSALLDEAGADGEARAALIRCIREKNAHETAAVCREAAIPETAAARIASAASLYGPLADTLPLLRTVCAGSAAEDALDELAAVHTLLRAAGCDGRVNFDFSIVHDMDYYNGILMSGCIPGIPRSVLSGGRYDRLLSRMGKSGGAIGFAVNLDLLERYREQPSAIDADILLLYGDDTDPAALMQAVNMLCAGGKSVRAQKCVPEGFRCRQLLSMKDRGLEILENNA